jgi:hypothetical protein
VTSSAIGRLGQLDGPTLMKVQAGCNYINAEIQKRRSKVGKVSIIAAALGLLWYAVLWRQGVRDPRLPIAAAIVVAGGYATRVSRTLAKDYKHIVVRRVVNALGQGLTYSPESRFTKQNFLDMDLFEKRAEQWHAEDEVSGRKNAVAYSILEANATRTEGSGKSRRTVTIFRGLIVRLDFNKHFASHTVVVPDAESKILGGLFGEWQGRRGKELVSLENADFEGQFSVYSTDQQQARYLLTPKLMELILEAQALLGSQLRLSFHDNSVFVTVPQSWRKNRFEVSLFGAPVTPETAAGELAEVIKLAERLVDTLDLETRIWSRA